MIQIYNRKTNKYDTEAVAGEKYLMHGNIVDLTCVKIIKPVFFYINFEYDC